MSKPVFEKIRAKPDDNGQQKRQKEKGEKEVNNRRNTVVYVSGKMTAKDKQEEKNNILIALSVAAKLWNIGFTALCPHTNAPQPINGCGCRYEEYIEGDLELLSRCDAIFMLYGWEQSVGATLEHQEAEKLSLPIFYEIESLMRYFDKK